MLLGNPYKFAFLIERIPDWEKGSWKNGIMFVIINDNIYPKNVRATTFNSEIPEILGSDSAFISPIIDKELYEKNDLQIIEFVDDKEKENYYRYFIPFHKINDSDYRFYIISDSFNVKILVCKLENDKTELVDILEISIQEYNEIKFQVIDFFRNAEFWFILLYFNKNKVNHTP